MNTAEADQLVVGSLAVTATLAVLKRVSAGDPPDVVRVLIGAFVAGTMLTIAAEPAPALAGSLAVLILIASVIFAGPDVLNVITHATGAPNAILSTVPGTDQHGAGLGGGARINK